MPKTSCSAAPKFVVLDSSKPSRFSSSSVPPVWPRPLLLSWHLPSVSKQDHLHTLLNWNQICTWILLRSLVANTEKRVSPTSIMATDCDQLRRRRWDATASMGPLCLHMPSQLHTVTCGQWVPNASALRTGQIEDSSSNQVSLLLHGVDMSNRNCK